MAKHIAVLTDKQLQVLSEAIHSYTMDLSDNLDKSQLRVLEQAYKELFAKSRKV